MRSLTVYKALSTMLISTSAFAAPPTSISNDNLKKISSNLLNAMSQNSVLETSSAEFTHLHRVIVTLDASSQASVGTANSSNSYEQLENAFIKNLTRIAPERVIRRYNSIPAVSMELSDSDIYTLADKVSVTRLDMMEIYYKNGDEAHPLTRVNEAHVRGIRGQGMTVAVIDDGLDTNHPAFGGQAGFPTQRVLGGFDFADNDADPRNDCNQQSHGTGVSGIIAGNGGGITGVAPDSNLVFLKIQSSGRCGEGALDGDLVGAIDWVVTNKDRFDISILSMSLGGGAFASVAACEQSSGPLTRVLDAAERAGIVTLAASGNDGLCSQMSRPACVGSVISVGATYDANIGQPGFCVNANSCAQGQAGSCPAGSKLVRDNSFADKVTAYSNSTSFLDLLAPSHCATTAAPGNSTQECFGGTSAATPYAAGVTALVMQAAGGTNSLSRSQVVSTLRSTGVAVTDDKNSRSTPRVNAIAAIDAVASDNDDPPPATTPPPSGQCAVQEGADGSAGGDLVECGVDDLSICTN